MKYFINYVALRCLNKLLYLNHKLCTKVLTFLNCFIYRMSVVLAIYTISLDLYFYMVRHHPLFSAFLQEYREYARGKG